MSDAYKYHESVKTVKYQQRVFLCGTQQLCSTNFCVYWRSRTGLYKNRSETRRETKRKTEGFILRDNKFYKNQNKFAFLRSAIFCLRVCKKLKNTSNITIQSVLQSRRLDFNSLDAVKSTSFVRKFLPIYLYSVGVALSNLCTDGHMTEGPILIDPLL